MRSGGFVVWMFKGFKMSSDKAPQKLHWVQDDSGKYYSTIRQESYHKLIATYIRQDLALAITEAAEKGDAGYADYLAERTAYDMKQQAIAIIQRHLDSITEARKDTTGLGMIQHIIKMILAEVNGL